MNNWLDGCGEEVYLIIDEAHHATAKTYRRIIEYVRGKVPNVKLLGLSATPFRNNPNEEGLLKKIFPDDIVYKTDLTDLIKRQILSTYYAEEVNTDIDMIPLAK